MHYLYKITNQVNGKIYIGQAKNYNQRWRQHKQESKREQPRMIINRAMKKHGIGNFTFEIIASCKTLDDANEIETILVKQYESHISTNKGYNVSNGGSNAPKTEAWRQQMRAHWADPIYKTNVLETIKQAHASRTPEEKAETAKLLSETLQGRHLSPDTEFKNGHKLSPEALKKLSDSLTGTTHPERQGIPLTQETKNKLSKALNGKPAWNKDKKTGIKPHNFGKTKIKYPEDQILLTMVNEKGLTAVAKELGSKVSTLCLYMKRRELKHNRPTTNPSTQFGNGLNHSGSKLTSDQVLEIVFLHRTGNYTQEKLSQLFNVSRATIKKIIKGETWNYLTHIK